MSTYHIHITGLVQGVGFRPHVYRLASRMSIPGQVSNTPDGVHILFNASDESAGRFYTELIEHPPIGAHISRHHIGPSQSRDFDAFSIAESAASGEADLLPAPDIACCDHCRAEIQDPANRRYRYPFTTCVDCGPRYSILTQLPYDRAHTAMSPFEMCPDCAAEYNNPGDRRFYSQTSSCGDCAIPLRLYDRQGDLVTGDTGEIYSAIGSLLSDGAIIAVKGMGGYLLLCDARNEKAVRTLRTRKHRPQRPFALLYEDMPAIRRDAELSDAEWTALTSPAGPIVIAKLRQNITSAHFRDWVAPGLDTIGVMLPCTPLLQIIASDYGLPLVATSANISGSPIIYRDEEALNRLTGLADYILVYERDIITPQDDSVLQLAAGGTPILLRRSRGLAPNYFPNPFRSTGVTMLGMGAELKAAFALQHADRLYISQNLGDQGSLDAQQEYQRTLDHWQQLLGARPGRILIDAHPGYFVSRLGEELAETARAELIQVQHHKAHFAAVLAENGILHTDEKVLGFIWDGTGYGPDGNVWGGETFLLDNGTIKRAAHWDYFPQFPGEKMSREPLLSALSLTHRLPDTRNALLRRLPGMQAQFYTRWLENPKIYTSSMGRFLDGISCLLGITDVNTYEGEAAMKLECLARNHSSGTTGAYPIALSADRIGWQPVVEGVLEDLRRGAGRAMIARKLFVTLANAVGETASRHNVRHLAFSGGVFQNRLLVETIMELLGEGRQLYFHRQLSPNDECIGFGQIAYFNLRT